MNKRNCEKCKLYKYCPNPELLAWYKDHDFTFCNDYEEIV